MYLKYVIRFATVIITTGLLSACGSDSVMSEPAQETPPPKITETNTASNLAIPDNRDVQHYQVLLFGNSHVSAQASLITKLILAGNSNVQVSAVNAAGGYLDNPVSQQRRLDILASKSWSHIILQAQKYSQSGTVSYPIIAARTWIATAKESAITPILFPEHPQKGRPDEGRQVHSLHQSIAAVQKACVAPVGLAWNKTLMTDPSFKLHSTDGNHASLMGNLLTALVFYEVITGQSADLLPYIADIAVEESTQQLLGQIASETIQANQACEFD
ncbi:MULTISPECIES: hypothetical protein [unclassified Shewanella]|uniref:hypothetical protein n=1 Tax=unclassified Shewanella TaxID=196818 RepID=UPI0035513CC2